MTFKFPLAISFATATLLSTAAMAQDAATVAFLMPDQASTRYEQHDFPGFKAAMEKLCATCTVIYQNANADVALQQQQFNSVLAQGAKVIVLDPVDSSAAASLVTLAQGEIVKRLGAWAALLAAPTLITSWYGMNFEHMPELAGRFAYPILIAGVALACFGLYRLFKRSRWL